MIAKIRISVYNLLVNRKTGICKRYHKFHDKAHGVKKIFSWLYLICLNFCYYILFCHFLGDDIQCAVYEKKKLLIDKSESEAAFERIIPADRLIEKLSAYDIVSFDIFDTLIFRPFSAPSDLFYLLGCQTQMLDFKNIRTAMESSARYRMYKNSGTYEVTIFDIWKEIEEQTGLSSSYWKEELDLEKEYCFANPYMQKVFNSLIEKGIKVIITSDMYIPSSYMEDLLKSCGYTGYDRLFVSCDLKKSKADGQLYTHIRSLYPGSSLIHIGDNYKSDYIMAHKHGFDTFYYPNVNGSGERYRAYDMSPVIGGAYRGLVNTHLYNGALQFSREYEYGFIYGGLFVTGYCNFIHNYATHHSIDKVLFLSRDGDILKHAYDIMFPGNSSVYVHWSRKAATKLTAGINRYDYIRRFLYHKVNQNIPLSDIFASMSLSKDLTGTFNLNTDECLTNANVEAVRHILLDNWDAVVAEYKTESKAASQYYKNIVKGCRKVCAVDIGWAGSGAVALNNLFNKEWGIDCDVTGIIAGTNTLYNTDADAGEPLLQSKRLVSYMYSASFNRDLIKKHNPNRGYNQFWELLLASTDRQCTGFGFDSDNNAIPLFGRCDINQDGILMIQNGIIDFVKLYGNHFENSFFYNISGRDAYAPMLAAASDNEKYLRSIYSNFNVEANVI